MTVTICLGSACHVKGSHFVLEQLKALIKENNEYHEVSVPKVKAVDTTAAGDTFCGSLCVALSEDMNVLDAVKFANKCASITVTRMGAQSALPYRKEIDIL